MIIAFLFSIFEGAALPVSARVEGCGLSGFIDGPNTLFYNPAQLAKQSWNEASLNFHNFDEINNYSIGFSMPIKHFVIGFAGRFITTTFELRNEFDELLGQDSFQDVSIKIGAGFKSGSYNIGAGVNLFYEKISTLTHTQALLDTGFSYTYNNITLSAALNNIGVPEGRNKKTLPPYTLRIGVSAGFLDEALNTGIEFVLREKNFIAGAGIEYLISNLFYIRGGFNYKSNTTIIDVFDILRIGFGFLYSEKYDYLIDFAYIPSNIQGNSLLISTGIRF